MFRRNKSANLSVLFQLSSQWHEAQTDAPVIANKLGYKLAVPQLHFYPHVYILTLRWMWSTFITWLVDSRGRFDTLAQYSSLFYKLNHVYTVWIYFFFRSVSLKRDAVVFHKPTAALPTLSWWATEQCLFSKHSGSSSNLLLSCCEGAPHAMPRWVGHTLHLQFLEMPLTLSRLQDCGVALLWGYELVLKLRASTDKNPTSCICCLQSATSPTSLHDCIIKACFQRSFIIDDVSSSASCTCDSTPYESTG